MATYQFLSDPWIDAARAIKGAHPANGIDQAGLVVNATITGVPFDGGTMELHSEHGPVIGWEPGHVARAAFSISADYALARELILDRTLDVLAQAVASGSLHIEGDAAELRRWWAARIANPDAGALDDELRAITA